MNRADQSVQLTMEEEGRATDLRHKVDVSESVADNILEKSTCLFADYISNGHKWTDQNHCARVTRSSQKCGWSCANGPSKHYNLLLFDSLHDGQVVIHILGVEAYLLRVRFAFIYPVALVLHGENVSL